MNYTSSLIAVTVVGVVAASGAVLAQTPKPAPETSPPAAAQPSTTQKVEDWTRKQWETATKKWAKDKEKWADCRKQAHDQNLTGRKSWSFLYQCMTG